MPFNALSIGTQLSLDIAKGLSEKIHIKPDVKTTKFETREHFTYHKMSGKSARVDPGLTWRALSLRFCFSQSDRKSINYCIALYYCSLSFCFFLRQKET